MRLECNAKEMDKQKECTTQHGVGGGCPSFLFIHFLRIELYTFIKPIFKLLKQSLITFEWQSYVFCSTGETSVFFAR